MAQRNVLVWNSELGRFQDRRFVDLSGELLAPEPLQPPRQSRLKSHLKRRLGIKEWRPQPGPCNALLAHEQRKHKHAHTRWAKIFWWRKKYSPSLSSAFSNRAVLTYSNSSFVVVAGREVFDVAPEVLEPKETGDVEESDAARRVREWAVREEMRAEMMRREMVPLIC